MWFDNSQWESLAEYHIKNCKPATDKEVEEALIKEAKKRGFKIGVKYKNSPFNQGEYTIKKYQFSDEYKNTKTFGLEHYSYTVFKDGKWAEILEETKPTIAGHEMEQVIAVKGNKIKFGCKEYYESDVKDLYYACGEINVNSLEIEGNTISFKQLKEIVDYIK